MKPTTPTGLPNLMKVAATASQIVAVVQMFMAALLVNAALPKKAK